MPINLQLFEYLHLAVQLHCIFKLSCTEVCALLVSYTCVRGFI